MSRPLEAIPIDLSDKRVVVTGATAGIGHEAALELAKLGADVTVVGRTDAKAAAARRNAARVTESSADRHSSSLARSNEPRESPTAAPAASASTSRRT
jgi:NAD(P)-dependent dehydrogenase (short-subunit alcohol dehydrogenase family)